MPIYETVSADYSDNLTVKQALLSHFIKSKSAIDKDDKDNDKNEKLLAALTDIINGANSIVTMIDQKAVAMELGVKEDKENPASVTARKDADTKVNIIIIIIIIIVIIIIIIIRKLPSLRHTLLKEWR